MIDRSKRTMSYPSGARLSHQRMKTDIARSLETYELGWKVFMFQVCEMESVSSSRLAGQLVGESSSHSRTTR